MDPGALGGFPANVHVEAWVPQRDVLPRVTALVCHGGSGTVLGALGAGLPMVVVPLFADQPHNARRIAAASAGLALPAPDANALRAAIERVLADPELRRGARRVADEIAALSTVERPTDPLIGINGPVERHACALGIFSA
jgi:UDP:flavonoid glycosyltransferase YjiC (YdhE family)